MDFYKILDLPEIIMKDKRFITCPRCRMAIRKRNKDKQIAAKRKKRNTGK